MTIISSASKRYDRATHGGMTGHMTGHRALRATASAAVLALCLGVSATASAQDADEAPAPADSAIIVTGSRITTPGFVSPTPITGISQGELQMSGKYSAQQLQEEIPALIPNQATQMVSAPPGSSNMNLRGLGASRTLLLIDGRRVAPTSPEGTVDVNIIPVALLKRVEVVTGGASAAYGSDAVSGVVNLFLDNEYEGIKGNGQFGTTQYGDANEYVLSLTAGKSFAGGRGHIVASGGYYRNDGLLNQDARPWGRHQWGVITNPFYVAGSNNGQTRLLVTPNITLSRLTEGGLIVSGPLQGTQFGAGGVLQPFTYGDYVGTQFMVGGSGINYSGTGNLAPVQNQRNAFVHGSYDLTDTIQFWVEGLYAQSEQSYDITPNFDLGNLVVKRDNAYMPAALATLMDQNNLTSVTIGRSDPELGYNYADSTYRDWRISTGLKGKIFGNWSWDLYYQYTHNTYDYKIYNNRNEVKWKNAVDSVLVNGQPVCRINADANPANDDPACIPVNIFGIGSIAPNQVPYVSGTTHLVQQQTQHDIALNIDGTLFRNWAGDVAVAFGGEYRKDTLTGSTDATSLLKQWRVLNPQPTDGGLSVKEGYAEIVFPVLVDTPFFKKLEINAAGRITDYSRSGEVETWKAGVNWTISSDIRLRATRSRDIRAPNLNELFQARGANVGSFNDPRTNTNISIFWSSGGNPNLKPEKADTFTIGGVLSPTFVPGLQMSIDYYNIKIKDVISTFGAQQVLDGCYLRGQTGVCSGIHIDPATNLIQSVDAVRFNAEKLSTAGLDFEVSYRTSVDRVIPGMNGNLSLRVLANYIDRLITTASGVPTDNAGSSLSTPHWRANLNATYSNGPFRATVLVRWIESGVLNTTYVEGVDINNNHVPGRTYVNVSAEHKLGDHFTVFGKVDNLFNVYPPLTPNTVLGPQTATSPLFDTLGRKFAIGARFEF